MAKKKTTNKARKTIESYAHGDKQRANIPPVGLVTPRTDPEQGKAQTYAHDPHIDPQLHWAGKAENTSFEVPTVSLHVHERIDPCTIVEAVRKRNGGTSSPQASLFEEVRDVPLRHEIEFYKHAQNWSNRLIAGDSLLVMNSLLQKENMAGKVQCVYMDPPYGIKYGSNFQPFTNKRDVKDGKDEDLTAEPEMIKAFRDTWELGIHSYLSYMRDRLLLAREMLSESGSCFVQISDQNVHFIRNVMDEVFGVENFVSEIIFRTRSTSTSKNLSTLNDYTIWYGKNVSNIKFRRLFVEKSLDLSRFCFADINGKTVKADETKEIDRQTIDYFSSSGLFSTSGDEKSRKSFEFLGKKYIPAPSRGWRCSIDGLQRLAEHNRILVQGNSIRYKYFHKDFPFIEIGNLWNDQMSEQNKSYVVQTAQKVIQRCILMTTDPGDIVLDPTCGSGTTAFVAEQWGRRWITCDTSRVATTLAKQRLMTATFDYYKLAHPDEGVGSGFEYKKVPHITLKSIANNEPPATETLFDQPFKDTKRARVTGPFTVEAVPSPTVQPIDDVAKPEPAPADASIVRSGATLHQNEWCDELLNTGIRAKGGQRISFSRVESAPYRWLHADAETKPDDAGTDQVKDSAATAHQIRRAVISFGPEHAPMEQRQVENAWQEAQTLMPRPQILIFAAFQFDPEAAKDIDELAPEKVGMNFIKVQMNADLQTTDLKKKRASNESFWLIGQPEITIEPIRKGNLLGQYQVEVKGFDYFNTKTGQLESGGENQIAMWMLDSDYDGRSLYPTQVFFPMSNPKSGWSKLARNLKAEIDEGLIEAYRGTMSLPFEIGKNSRIAVKIVDDRGIESLRVLDIQENN